MLKILLYGLLFALFCAAVSFTFHTIAALIWKENRWEVWAKGVVSDMGGIAYLFVYYSIWFGIIEITL